MTGDASTAMRGGLSVMSGDVREYLLTHPDFLDENEDVLAALVPPVQKRGDGVEDFQRYMLARLQDNFAAIKGEHDDLMSLMQEHVQRQNRLNVAALTLLDAPDLESILVFMTRDLRLLLDQEIVSLFLESCEGLAPADYGYVKVMETGFIARWLAGRDIVLEEQPVFDKAVAQVLGGKTESRSSSGDAARELFGDKAVTVGSRALVRFDLGEGMPEGLLALGHRESMYYATGLATEQIEFLGAIFERCLQKAI